MNFKIFLIIFILLLSSCVQNDTKKINLDIIQDRFSNKGFTLVYKEELLKSKVISKKIDNRSYLIYHKNLKKNSNVKITNLSNNKSVIAKVKSNKVDFPVFFNSIVTKRISDDLDLNESEPYIEISLIQNNSSFVAKKSKMFDEEKKVAEKAPVDGIQINDLNKSVNENKKKVKKNFSYSIKIADFYYKRTAEFMLSRIKDETSIKSYKIIELTKTKYRVILGPFNDIKSLKDSYNKTTILNFENLEVVKND
jgi:hypothetical protein